MYVLCTTLPMHYNNYYDNPHLVAIGYLGCLCLAFHGVVATHASARQPQSSHLT